MTMPFSSKIKKEQKEEKYCVELDKNLYEWLKEIASYTDHDSCDLTIDVELNGPSRIVLACSEYEIEIQSGVDGPGPVENRPASAPLGGQAGRTQNKG
jgi:hypothetical protein